MRVNGGDLTRQQGHVPERRVEDERPEAEPLARLGCGYQRCEWRPHAQVVGQDVEAHRVDPTDTLQPNLEGRCRVAGNAAEGQRSPHARDRTQSAFGPDAVRFTW